MHVCDVLLDSDHMDSSCTQWLSAYAYSKLAIYGLSAYN